ncbi:ABC transporter substrate-binding protein [Allopusillimonas soli]|uniref:ABC transporter substrate-binding protein n=1 Tax=Allopusillimonas soli TaxID=659016 RepID=A0A853FEL8_9BURK|nr:tripartite tricarboxylate transporter substrate-binding protein [Allopusillimonas soli]NYT36486.1 ABC transporter substrate-binding protein [Allopusillimonas soli]TEA74990.1 ABC transporter substrate-binding protein [Allopusillimonas soli]
MNPRRRQLMIAAAASAACLIPSAAFAGNDRVVRMLVGFSPGGAVDLVARALADAMKASGYTVVVENKAGAGGRIATDALLSATDDYTILVTPDGNLTLYPHIYRNLRYQRVDLAPISTISEFDFGFAVGAQSPARALSDYLSLAKSDAAMASYGIPGTGTAMQFLGAMLARETGVPLTPVPYKGGAVALADTIGGIIPALITTTPNLIPMHKAGKIRILATSGAQPSSRLESVPTFASLGYADLTLIGYFAAFCRANTPQKIVSELNAAISQAVQSTSFQDTMNRLDFKAISSTPQALTSRMENEDKFWDRVVRKSGYTPS